MTNQQNDFQAFMQTDMINYKESVLQNMTKEFLIEYNTKLTVTVMTDDNNIHNMIIDTLLQKFPSLSFIEEKTDIFEDQLIFTGYLNKYEILQINEETSACSQNKNYLFSSIQNDDIYIDVSLEILDVI